MPFYNNHISAKKVHKFQKEDDLHHDSALKDRDINVYILQTLRMMGFSETTHAQESHVSGSGDITPLFDPMVLK